MPLHRSWTSGTDSTSGSSSPGDSAASRVVKDEHTNKRARPDLATFVARNPPPRSTTNLATPQNSILHVGLVKTHGGRCLPSALEFAPVQVDNVVFHFPLPPSSLASSASSEIAPFDSVTDLKINLEDHKSITVVTTALDDPPPDHPACDPFQEEELERGRQMSTTPGLSRRTISEPKVLENPCDCNRDRSSSNKRPGSKAGRESLQALRERLDRAVPEADEDAFKRYDTTDTEKLGAKKKKKKKNLKEPMKTISYQSVCPTRPEKIISYQSLCPSGEPIDHTPAEKPNGLSGFQRRQFQRQRLESFDTMRDLPIAAEFKRRDSEIERLFGEHQRRPSKGIRPSTSRSSKADRFLGEAGISDLDHTSPSRPTTSASKADRLLGEVGTIRSSREGKPNIPSRASTLIDSDNQSIFRKGAGSATKHISSHVRRISNHDAQTLWKPSDLWKPNAKIDRAATVASRTSVTISSAALAKKLGVPISTDVGLERGNCSSHDMGAFAHHHNSDDDDPYTILPGLDKALSFVGSTSSEATTVNIAQNVKRMGLLLEANE